jgi:2',3'-cyclic-nucleotide 2'-phosphodiesterase (5'-nucleotidase family)
VDVALLNAGSIRGDTKDGTDERKYGRVYPAGDLTDDDVSGWLPYLNAHQVFEMTGTQLKSILERSANALPPTIGASGHTGGWFLHAAGLEYKIECSKTRQELNKEGDQIKVTGERVTYIKVGDKVVLDAAGSVDELSSFKAKVGVNSFLATGSDGHLAFKEIDEASRVTISETELDHIGEVKAYIKKNSPVTPKKDGRLVVVGNCNVPIE